MIFACAVAAPLVWALNSYVATETESSSRVGCVQQVSDATGSSGSAVKFGGGCSVAGARLPISYNLASLGANVKHVATNGVDTNAGTQAAPYATLSRAISQSSSGGNIVIRGGTYRGMAAFSLAASKSLKFIAYPGEIPTFNGADTVATGDYTTEGSLRYISYTPRPATDGSGISFTTGENLNGDDVGMYPDQAWVGTKQLQQVTAKTSVNDDTFWVDRTNNRLYVSSANATNTLEVSQLATFASINSPNTTLEGLRIIRYSNTASDYGVIKFYATADDSVMRDVEMSDFAFQTMMYVSGGSDHNDGSLLQNVTISSSNWMGVDVDTTDNLTIDSVRITNMNQFNEFSFSPQSGAIKTSRAFYTKVLNSEIVDNNSHAIWFDQSNYDAQIANNIVTGNNGSSVFFEISDGLLLINNYVHATNGTPVKLAGSSGMRLVNNTIVGSSDPIGIYTDSRSKPGCSDPAEPLCSGSYNSDRDTSRPHRETMDWMPRLDYMINNIIAYPTRTGLCGQATAVCITQSNSTASAPLNTQIHQADAARGIPRTYINGNVYANGSSRIWTVASPSANYTTHTAFASAMAGSPVSISGFESKGLTGNSYVNADGSPTSALTALHSQAEAIPTDAMINQYIPAGTKHYGVTTK